MNIYAWSHSRRAVKISGRYGDFWKYLSYFTGEHDGEKYIKCVGTQVTSAVASAVALPAT